MRRLYSLAASLLTLAVLALFGLAAYGWRKGPITAENCYSIHGAPPVCEAAWPYDKALPLGALLLPAAVVALLLAFGLSRLAVARYIAFTALVAATFGPALAVIGLPFAGWLGLCLALGLLAVTPWAAHIGRDAAFRPASAQ